MGNCLNAKYYSRDGAHEEAEKMGHDQMQLQQHESPKTFRESTGDTDAKKVRFKVGDDQLDSTKSDGGGGVLRLRVVVTQEELNQILGSNSNYKDLIKCSSVEQLLNIAMKVRSCRKVNNVQVRRESRSNWKPCLESIPEDH